MILFDIRSITRTEVVADVVLSAVFLAATAIFIGLRPDHWLLVGLFNVLYFASPRSRKLAVALLPFVIFAISYDWMRIKPNYEVNPVDVKGLYEAEKSLFGINVEGVTMIPGEYFNIHNTAIGDLLSGIFYLCWVPVPIAFGIWLFFKGEHLWYLRFALAFLFVNLLGFFFYYVHPAAPPWYVMSHGFDIDYSTPGNVAGLSRFQQLVGWNVFDGLYNKNANIFAAVPSLHAAYMLIALVYAKLSKQHWGILAVFAVITAGIWWTAVYSAHHYIIDVLLGIACAFLGIAIFEWGLLRIGCIKRGLNRYANYIGSANYY